MSTTIQQPLKWHGGKAYLADWIISHMPPHTHYVEPYAGGLAVLLRKPCEGVSEVVNDIDGELVNFWRMLQSPGCFEEFKRIVEAVPFAKDEFDFGYARRGDAVSRAVCFFIRCRQSRQGLRKDFATLSRTRTRRGMNEQASSWWSAIDGLEETYHRLRRVVILNDDACKVIRQQDGPDTLFYLDPPYLHETRATTGEYEYEMTTDEHLELLEVLAGIKGTFLLSGYPSKLYDEFAAACHWRSVQREIDCKASSKAKKEKRSEVLWMNYKQTAACAAGGER